VSRAVAVFVAVVALAGAAFAQESRPRFEVESVRALPPSSGLPPGFAMNPRRTGDRLTWTTSLYDLTRYAYSLPAWRLSGIEPQQSYVAIAAKVDPRATPADIRLMLRALLIDRFKLVVRTTREQRSGYTMMVAKNGPKLEMAKADGSMPPMPAYMGSPRPAPGPFEGYIFTSAEDGCCAITGRRVPIARLADELSAQIGAFVIDQTGLKGTYYFGFKFQRLDRLDADAADAPSVFNALEDELGLTLNKTTGEVEMLVVTHVEKVPTEN
jgi:uncharacterized protein (TIGR03435 family)